MYKKQTNAILDNTQNNLELNKTEHNSQIQLESKIELVENVSETSNSKNVNLSKKAQIKNEALFDKNYYSNKLVVLKRLLEDSQKELKQNKDELIPLLKIQKSHQINCDKLRKKELQVAKQSTMIYSVNSRKINATKKAKLDENFRQLNELKTSVKNGQIILDKNKDRIPILEKNYNLLLKQIDRVNLDIEDVKNAIYWNKINN